MHGFAIEKDANKGAIITARTYSTMRELGFIADPRVIGPVAAQLGESLTEEQLAKTVLQVYDIA